MYGINASIEAVRDKRPKREVTIIASAANEAPKEMIVIGKAVMIINTPPVIRLLLTIHPPIILSKPTVNINMPSIVPAPPYIEPIIYVTVLSPINAAIAAINAKINRSMPAIIPVITAETLPDCLDNIMTSQ